MTPSEHAQAVPPSPELILLDFRAKLRACTSCTLSEAATPVPWSGDVSPDLLIIGEAPGETEDREGEPMVGPAGQRLRHVLRVVGLSHLSTAYVNVVSCFPGYKLRSPQYEHISACRPWFRGQVGLINPSLVLTVGLVAFQAVRGAASWPGLSELHGKPMYWEGAPAPSKPRALWSTYHPANMLPSRPQSGKYTRIITEDLAALKTWLDNGEVVSTDCYVCQDEVYRYDEWGIPFCRRHSARQGALFPEDVGAS